MNEIANEGSIGEWKLLKSRKFCKWWFFILLLIVVVQLSCANRKINCDDFRVEYGKIAKSKDTSKMLEFLNTNTQYAPCIDFNVTKGDLYFSMDSANLAIRAFKNVLRVDSSNVYANFRLGLCYQSINNDDSAIFYLKSALHKKTFQGAVIDYPALQTNDALGKEKYDVDHKAIFFSLGKSYYYQNKLKGALNCFNYCIQESFMLKESYLYRGTIVLELNHGPTACSDLEKAISLGSEEATELARKYCK